MKIISWNIAGRIAPWHRLLEVGVDIALLQEAAAPPPEVAARIDADPAPWDTPGVDAQRKWRTAVVRLSERVQVDWIEAKPLLDAGWGDLAVSRPGTIAAAKVTPADGEPGEPLVVVSMYGLWAGSHASTGNSWIVADDSVHRAVSDLSAFIGSQQGHRILTAGDLNILYGYGDHGNTYWAGRPDERHPKGVHSGKHRLIAAGTQWATGCSMAWRTAPRQQERSHILLNAADSGNSHPPTGLRIRVQEPCPVSGGEGSQRAGPLGAERPLCGGDCGRLRQKLTTGLP